MAPASAEELQARLARLESRQAELAEELEDVLDELWEGRFELWRASRPWPWRLRTRLLDALAALGAHPLEVLRQYAPRPMRLREARKAALAAPPAITLVTPSLDQGAFLEQALESVSSQRYPGLQHVVQDGGSRDGSIAILERRGGSLDWESRPDAGQAEALDRGFARARGELLAWLNADDVLLPGALACVAEYFSAHPEVDVVYGHRIVIDEAGQEVGRWLLPRHDDDALRWADYVPQETLFWRRGLWQSVGARLDESYDFALDWELLLRFRERGARFARLDRFLAAFRLHPGQKTARMLHDQGRREMRRLRRREHGRVVAAGEVALQLRRYRRRAALLGRLHRLGLYRC